MSTDEGAAAVAKVTLLVREEDWQNMLGIMDLRDRVAALEAAAAQPATAADPAPAGVSVEELADSLPANAWAGPEGYSRQAFARHLLDHPRIGPLLRGEGTGAPRRVVLAEEPNDGPALYELNRTRDRGCFLAGWKACRAEAFRQGGQVAAPKRVVLPKPPAPVPTLPLQASSLPFVLSPLNGWGAYVNGNLSAIYSDRDGAPGYLLWSADGGTQQGGQADV